MLKDLLRNKFIQNSAIYATGTILVGVLNYVFHFLIARQVSVAEYGELQSLLSLLAISGVFSVAIHYLIVKYAAVFAAAKDHTASEQFRRWVGGFVNKLGISFFLVFLICIPFLKELLHLSDVWGVFFVGVAAVVSLSSIVYIGVLMGWEMFGTANAVTIAATAVKLCVGVAIGYLFPKASFIAASFFLMAIAGWLIAKYFVHKDLGIHADASVPSKWQIYISFDTVKKSIVPVTFFSLFMLCLANLDVLLVKSLTTAELTGYFGAFKVLGNIILTVNTAIVTVTLPGACAEGYKGNGVSKRMLASAYGLISLVSIMATALYFLLPDLIVPLFFGETYAALAHHLWLFGIMAWVLSLFSLEANFAYARHDFRILYALGASIAGLLLSVILFHGTLAELAVSISVAFAIGFVWAVALRVVGKRALTNGEKLL